MFIIHLGVRLDIWATQETTEVARISVSVMRIRAELTSDYDKLNKQKKGHSSTEVQELTPGMFGAGTAAIVG